MGLASGRAAQAECRIEPEYYSWMLLKVRGRPVAGTRLEPCNHLPRGVAESTPACYSPGSPTPNVPAPEAAGIRAAAGDGANPRASRNHHPGWLLAHRRAGRQVQVERFLHVHLRISRRRVRPGKGSPNSNRVSTMSSSAMPSIRRASSRSAPQVMASGKSRTWACTPPLTNL